MIYIPSLKTARFTADIHEMYLFDSVKLTRMPEHLEQEQTTFAIHSMLEKTSTSFEDARMWTVQERMLAITNYIAGTQEDGEANFLVDTLNYTDYLQADKQYLRDYAELGEYDGDQWRAYHLLGYMAEEIERLEGEIVNPNTKQVIDGRLHWIIGCIACQLVPNDQFLDPTDTNYSQELLKRMIVIASLPESDFLVLYSFLQKAQAELMHLFEIAITDQGIVAVSKPVEKEGGLIEQQYARFLPSSIVSEPTRNLSRKFD